MKLMIQIPCLNESGTLGEVINALPRQLPGVDTVEYLVIDDGSSDDTARLAAELGVHYLVRHRRTRGLAAAFSTGIRESIKLGADIVVNTDGDHQYPGHYIALIVEPIIQRQADIVIGNRGPASDNRNPYFKRLLYIIGERIVSRLAGQDLPDPVSGFRAYSREAAVCTHIVTGFSYTIESLIQASHRGMAIEFVPINTNDASRPSRLFQGHLQFVIRSGITLLRVCLMYKPLQFFVAASLCFAIVGLLPIARFLLLYIFGHGDGHLQSLVLGAAMLSVSGLILVAGLLADLTSHNRNLLEQVLERINADALSIKHVQTSNNCCCNRLTRNGNTDAE